MPPFHETSIRGALTTHRLGRPVRFFSQTTSTNDLAVEAALAGAAEGLLIVADHQTAGRGRLARSWWSVPGSSLLMSLLLRPRLPAVQAGRLAMCLGLAVIEGIHETTGMRAGLKWPNDIVWQDRKLGGILSEMELEGEGIAYAVLGLGLNVNLSFSGRPEADMPAELADEATSLADMTGRAVDRLVLLAAILGQAEIRYEQLLAGISPHQDWAAHLVTLGQTVEVRTTTGSLRGRAVGIDAGGALLIETGAGAPVSIWAGDVVAVRPK